MTDKSGVVFDLGYQPYDGERFGRQGATRAVYRDGLRRVVGLRRKARRKILPALLAVVALAPAAFFVAFGLLTGDLIEDDENFFGAAEYFSFNATVTLLFVALAASELLLPVPPTEGLNIGRTTKAQALALLGPPRIIHRQFDGDLYVWRRTKSRKRSLTLLPVYVRAFHYSNGVSKRDDLSLLFDREGVLQGVGLRLENRD